MPQTLYSDRFMELVESRREQARREVDAIVAGYQPDKVILFGSLARGDVHTGSDVDLLIVKSGAEGRLIDRIGAVLQFTSGEIDVEPLVYTPEELQRMVDAGNPLILRALAEGQVIYDRQQPHER